MAATVWTAPVDEVSRNRRSSATAATVESAVRAAGGFPTQGGGTRAGARARCGIRTTGGPV